MGFCPTSFDNLILSPKRKPCVLKFLNFLLNSYTNSKSSVKNLLSFLEFLVIQKIQISFLDIKESFLEVKEMFLEVKGKFLDVKEMFLDVKEMFLDVKEMFLEVKEMFLDVKEMFLEVKEMFLDVKKMFLDVKEMFLDEKKHSLDVKECFCGSLCAENKFVMLNSFQHPRSQIPNQVRNDEMALDLEVIDLLSDFGD